MKKEKKKQTNDEEEIISGGLDNNQIEKRIPDVSLLSASNWKILAPRNNDSHFLSPGLVTQRTVSLSELAE